MTRAIALGVSLCLAACSGGADASPTFADAYDCTLSGIQTQTRSTGVTYYQAGGTVRVDIAHGIITGPATIYGVTDYGTDFAVVWYELADHSEGMQATIGLDGSGSLYWYTVRPGVTTETQLDGTCTRVR